MTRAVLDEAKRADERERWGPGMVHVDAERLGQADVRFGAV